MLRGRMSFCVLTLNLWNINEPLEPRYQALTSGLKRLRPEFVCIQEVVQDPKSGCGQAELIADVCGFEHRFAEGGLALLSSQPPVRSISAALPQFPDDFPRSVLLVEMLVERRPLLVVNTHLAYPPALIEARRLQVEAMLAALERWYPRSGNTETVICGDFNDVPDSPAVSVMLESNYKFSDAFANCCPGRDGVTYSPRNPYVDRSWSLNQRIDYIFLSAGLVSEECEVVFDGKNGLDFVSDHFGVMCRIAYR
jgi:endonuclease/exonuclease/phosphatase family metal-dependent hydrolase